MFPKDVLNLGRPLPPQRLGWSGNDESPGSELMCELPDVASTLRAAVWWFRCLCDIASLYAAQSDVEDSSFQSTINMRLDYFEAMLKARLCH